MAGDGTHCPAAIIYKQKTDIAHQQAGNFHSHRIVLFKFIMENNAIKQMLGTVLECTESEKKIIFFSNPKNLI